MSKVYFAGLAETKKKRFVGSTESGKRGGRGGGSRTVAAVAAAVAQRSPMVNGALLVSTSTTSIVLSLTLNGAS